MKIEPRKCKLCNNTNILEYNWVYTKNEMICKDCHYDTNFDEYTEINPITYEAFFSRGEWGKEIVYECGTIEQAKKIAWSELKKEIGKIKRGTELEWVIEKKKRGE